MKSFCVYDSSPLEYFHHVLQFYIMYSNPASYMQECSLAMKHMLDIGYAIHITPIFQNIKIYFKPSDKIKILLDTCTCISFLLVRGRFNYYYLFSGGSRNVTYYIYNYTPQEYVNITYYMLHLSLCLICFMNFFWGYKIINKLQERVQISNTN